MISYSIQCAIVRGGTTKGIFINTNQLPADIALRDRVLLTLFGSPDVRQINGLGGGDPLTSKVALICASTEPDIDIDYRSGEVGIDEGIINYSTMCGNLASGVGLFALATNMIKTVAPETKVRIRNLNTGKLLEACIPINADHSVPQINCLAVDGVKGSGTEIKLTFLEPGGSITGELLPTGNATDRLVVDHHEYPCSIVDCGTLYAFFPANCFGLMGNEQPEVLDANVPFKETIEALREKVALLISTQLKKPLAAKQIKIAIFADTLPIKKNNAEIIARVINRYKTHKAFPVTGAICMSAASVIPNTLLNVDDNVDHTEHTVFIKHPEGIIATKSLCEWHHEKVNVLYTSVNRSARILMIGTADCFM